MKPTSSKLEQLSDRLQDLQLRAQLIGSSPCFLSTIQELFTAAKNDAAVTICGETGTGKELLARAIHYSGPRAAHPFIAVNCGCLPDSLLEDELFGHERGAFTDAQSRRLGLIARANHGTLFLDEVDTLTARAQVALLRVLQDHIIRPVGSDHEQQVDVRIVAATNASLEDLISTAQFRQDLFYRLTVLMISLPPLRERGDDVLLLAQHFLKKHAPLERRGIRLTPAAMALLHAHDWPGNVRELENVIIRGLSKNQDDAWIDVKDLCLPSHAAKKQDPHDTGSSTDGSFRAMKKAAVESCEKAYLVKLMAQSQGNISHAARVAGKDRREFGRLLKKYHLDSKTFRGTVGLTPDLS